LRVRTTFNLRMKLEKESSVGQVAATYAVTLREIDNEVKLDPTDPDFKCR